jgi:curved DNA-binding protein
MAGGADFSDFFESLFGSRAGRSAAGQRHARAARSMQGGDHHARISISLQHAYRGAQRSLSLSMPVVDAHGHTTLVDRQLDVSIPAGVRAGQHLRLQGQGAAGEGGGPAPSSTALSLPCPRPVSPSEPNSSVRSRAVDDNRPSRSSA